MQTTNNAVSHPAEMVQNGLKRLAFGRNNDAVQLIAAEEMPSAEQIQKMDFFGVSSVKRDKNGGMEVHFFDRLRALALLYEYSAAADSTSAAQSLLAALAGTKGEDADGI